MLAVRGDDGGMRGHTHVFAGPHPEVLADGTPVALGALASPDPDSPHDAAMIARGWLVTREEHDNANATDPEPKIEEPKRQRRTSSEEEKN